MNIAYTALVLFIYILPGIVFRKSMSTAGQFRQQRSLADELAQSVLFAAVGHVVWIPLSDAVSAGLFGGPKVDIAAALEHAMGQFGKDSAQLGPAIAAVADHLVAVVLYFGTLNAAMFAVGQD